MNDFTVTRFKIIVERAVRPVRACLHRKQRMREELLAHIVAAFEDDLEAHGDEAAALEHAIERFGDPAELTNQLQAVVPAGDAVDRLFDYIWFQPGESTVHRALRHGLLSDLLVFALMLGIGLVYQGPITSWPRALLIYGGSVLGGFFLFSFAFTFLADWMRQALMRGARTSRIEPILIVAATGLLVPGLGFALWLEFARLSVTDLLVVISLGAVISAILVHTAMLIAQRQRYHQEWADLSIDG